MPAPSSEERQIIKDLRKMEQDAKRDLQFERADKQRAVNAEKAKTQGEHARAEKGLGLANAVLEACKTMSLREARKECKRLAEEYLNS